jgi:hypothetical protein
VTTIVPNKSVASGNGSANGNGAIGNGQTIKNSGNSPSISTWGLLPHLTQLWNSKKSYVKSPKGLDRKIEEFTRVST